MSTMKKQFTVEQRVNIVKEAEQIGFNEAAQKHGISSRAIYRWKDKFISGGEKALKYGAKIDPEVRSLREENDRLKKLIVKQALIIEIKEELIKKTSLRISKESKS
jgi:transposase-like protein